MSHVRRTIWGIVCIYTALSVIPDQAFPTTVFSSTRRFEVQGLPAPVSVELAAWAEKVTQAVERIMGKSLHVSKRNPITIVAHAHPELDSGHVRTKQSEHYFRLRQRLELVNPRYLDQEDLLERLCWLILNRMVYVISDERRSDRWQFTPGWLSTGLAQHLFPILRERNKQLLVKRWYDGEVPPIATVLSWEYLPAGRWFRKAVCGRAVAWLLTFEQPTPAMEPLLWRLAHGRKLTYRWMREHWARIGTSLEFQKSWDLWLATQSLVRHDWGTLSLDAIARLRELCTFDATQYHLPSIPATSGKLTLSSLIQHRRASWIPRVTRPLFLEMTALAVGRPEEFRTVIDKFLFFLGRLDRTLAEDRPPVEGFVKPSSRRLKKELKHAEDALAKLEKWIIERNKFMDKVGNLMPHEQEHQKAYTLIQEFEALSLSVVEDDENE